MKNFIFFIFFSLPCSAAYDFQHTTLQDRNVNPDGSVSYLAQFSDNGQQPTVPIVYQFIQIPLAQDNVAGYHAIGDPIIASLNNPSTVPPVDVVLNTLIAFRDDFFPKIDASAFTNPQKQGIKQAFKDSAFTVYNEIVP